jgi:nucleotidyltransferase/DNA polymerase involved in DNA repair
MADDVWAWCEKANSRGRTVTVKIKWADFQISTRSRSMETTIQTREKLHQVALGRARCPGGAVACRPVRLTPRARSVL